MRNGAKWNQLLGALLTAAMAVTALPATAVAAEAVPMPVEADVQEAEPVEVAEEAAVETVEAVVESVEPAEETTIEAAEEITIEADEEIVSTDAAYAGYPIKRFDAPGVTRGADVLQQGSVVYMGEDFGEKYSPYRNPDWIVLDPLKTNNDKNGIFFLAKSETGYVSNADNGYVFFNQNKSKGNGWQGSDAQKFCKEYVLDVFSKEQKAILKTTKSDPAFRSDENGKEFDAASYILNGDQVFFLSAEEATAGKYGLNKSSRAWNSRFGYLLRSPATGWTDCSGEILKDGSLAYNYVNEAGTVRPAFNFNPGAVLFTSAALDSAGKVTGETGPDALKKVEEHYLSAWKFTLFDDGSPDAAGSRHSGFNATKSSFDGNTFKFKYSGAQIGDKEYISAIVTDDTGKTIKYYGTVQKVIAASGNASINLSGKLSSKDRLVIFQEQRNGDEATDYASTLCEMDLTVDTTQTVPVTGVTLNVTEISMTGKGKTSKLTATVAPASATNKDVTWKSSDTTVATVNSDGTVTSVGTGTATITVTTKDGGRTATCTVTVKMSTPIRINDVTLDKTSLTLEVGKKATLKATVTPAGREVSWTSSDTSVATVEDGVVTGVKAGTATIRVRMVGSPTVTASCTVTVTAPSKGTWKKDSKGWWYQRPDGSYPKNQWERIDGKWYHFDASGYMQTGWLKDGGKWYFLNSSGAMVTGWQKISNKWYYFESSGVMVTGWKKIGTKWYYFAGGGAMQTGWQKISNKWYYFENSGAMLANTSKTIGAKTYMFNASGVCTNP